MRNLLFILFFFPIISLGRVLDDNQVNWLKTVIFKSIQSPGSSHGNTGFTNSYDWHSDVHAHWALLSMARITGDGNLESRMLTILNIKRLEREFKFLQSSDWKGFELPYGRAWFLLLLKELSYRPISQDPTFRKIRDELTNEMLSWLSLNSFPEDGKTLIGTHNSWLMAFFLTELASIDLKTQLAQLEEISKNKIIPIIDKIDSHQMQYEDFLYLPALRQLVSPSTEYNLNPLALPKPKKFACHYPGAIQVSLWPHASECANNDAKSCEVVINFSKSFFKRTDLWKDDFDCVSHWVPQFMWMTHWLSLGRP